VTLSLGVSGVSPRVVTFYRAIFIIVGFYMVMFAFVYLIHVWLLSTRSLVKDTEAVRLLEANDC
jgi:hypothetical protein